jgi:hypothetical protein
MEEHRQHSREDQPPKKEVTASIIHLSLPMVLWVLFPTLALVKKGVSRLQIIPLRLTQEKCREHFHVSLSLDNFLHLKVFEGVKRKESTLLLYL